LRYGNVNEHAKLHSLITIAACFGRVGRMNKNWSSGTVSNGHLESDAHMQYTAAPATMISA